MYLAIRNTTGLRLRRAQPRRLDAGQALARLGQGAALLLLLGCGALQGGLLLMLVGLASWQALAR